jgi:signal transduction histidine kinase
MAHYVRIHNNVDWVGGQEVYYRLQDLEGNLLARNVDTVAVNGVKTYPVDIYHLVYPTVLGYQCIDPDTGGLMDPTEPASTTEPTIWVNEESIPTLPPMEGDWIADTAAPGDETYDWFENWGYEDQDGFHQYRLGMRFAPKYTVTLYLTDSVYEFEDHWSWELAEFGYTHRYNIIWVLGASLLLFAALFVYLCCAAGRKPKSEEVCPGGLNRLPLDLYAAAVAGGVFGLVVLFRELLAWVSYDGPHPGNLSLLMVNLLGIIILAEAFLFAFCAQVKVKGAFWWHHSVIGWLLGKLFKGICWVFRAIGRVFGMMNIIWQWLLTAALMAIATGLSFLVATISVNNGGDWQAIIGVLQFPVVALICIGIVFYGGYAFGMLLLGARKMAQGDLQHKVSTKYLVGSFRDCAEQLNRLSDTAMKEAQDRLRSERMKTELITNVSHDIKTPLTSIINFVDLLRKPHTEEEEQQYLEVLSRQSGRMKRLIEDLIDLSKATTGNIQVNTTRLDAAEAVQQALGEFSDKMEAVNLTPVFRHPEGQVVVLTDGRQMWRVLSNLLSNAVKYAMPGTRLYLDLARNGNQVLIAMKNVSREELKVNAEELLERFVQGDTSRSTEGSGLGLNIAQSLMELQGGTLQIQMDGDLFKVVLTFCAAE